MARYVRIAVTTIGTIPDGQPVREQNMEKLADHFCITALIGIALIILLMVLTFIR